DQLGAAGEGAADRRRGARADPRDRARLRDAPRARRGERRAPALARALAALDPGLARAPRGAGSGDRAGGRGARSARAAATGLAGLTARGERMTRARAWTFL